MDYERQVAAQLAIAEALLIFREFSSNAAPKGRQILGVAMVFGLLSVAQAGGESVQKLAARFGWLIVLAMAVGAVAKNPQILSTLYVPGSGTTALFPTFTVKQSVDDRNPSGTALA